MDKDALNRRNKLQKELKKLTKSPEWFQNKKMKRRVYDLRSELFPTVFSELPQDTRDNEANNIKVKKMNDKFF